MKRLSRNRKSLKGSLSLNKRLRGSSSSNSSGLKPRERRWLRELPRDRLPWPSSVSMREESPKRREMPRLPSLKGLLSKMKDRWKRRDKNSWRNKERQIENWLSFKNKDKGKDNKEGSSLNKNPLPSKLFWEMRQTLKKRKSRCIWRGLKRWKNAKKLRPERRRYKEEPNLKPTESRNKRGRMSLPRMTWLTNRQEWAMWIIAKH